MEIDIKNETKNSIPSRIDFVESFGRECWMYIKTVVDIVREPIIVLDKDLRVLTANETFYRVFQVEQRDTEGKIVYKLGNGQWNIPALRKLLEEILPQNTFFKGFEMTHNFPVIGKKSMVLNARQIHTVENGNPPLLQPMIFLAIEDATAIMAVGETLAEHIHEIATKNAYQTRRLEIHIEKLEQELKRHKILP
ncbi:MAG: PAS domain-containing protein [Minisyncoccia bacterium]